MRIAPSSSAPAQRSRVAFTLIEVVISITIFAMIMVGVLGCWRAIMRGKLAGEGAAAAAQRARIGIRAVEEALTCTEISLGNLQYYAFVSDTSEKFASLSLAARLPSDFPGSGLFGDLVMRRVTFNVVSDKGGTNDLIMDQSPLLEALDKDNTPYSITLARDVNQFMLEFWSEKDNDWVVSWDVTNALPKAVRITLGVGHSAEHPDVPYDLIIRTVTLPMVAHS